MDRKIVWAGVASFAVVTITVILTVIFAQPAKFRGTAYGEPYPSAFDFQLKQVNGNLFRLSDQRGKVVLLFFGYTTCPDVCPTTLAELNQALGKIGEKAGNVQVVFISVDPKRDTPEKIQEYASHFNPSFAGLSGSMDELEKIWQEYGVYREEVQTTSVMGYTVDHTARVTLIDADGNLRLSFGYQTPVDDIVHDLKLLLE